MPVLMGVLIGLAFLGSALTALPTVVVEVARRRSPEVVFYAPSEAPAVALTLDDGPSAATPRILDLLARHGARATFFVIGEHLRAHPETAERIVREGHELGHHMMSDRASISLEPEEFRRDFVEMDALLDGLGGSSVFRPGSGWYDQEMVDLAAAHGYRTVLGSVYPFDAHHPFAALSAWYVGQALTPGAVLVLHDGPERGARTAEVLRRLLPELAQRGLRVVPVSELLGEGPAEPR